MIDDLKPYPTMKNSGVEWLGDVPEHWKVEAVGPTPELADGYSVAGAAPGAQALKGTRKAYDWGVGGLVDWRVYDRYALAPGTVIDGPALIEERESTCVISAGSSVTVDSHFNLIAELSW